MLIKGLSFYPPDIRSIPYANYVKFQKYLILSAGIGNSTESVIQRAQTILTNLQNDRLEDAQNESSNLILSLFSAIEGLSHDSMAIACMVQGVPIATDADVDATASKIREACTAEEMSDYVDALKKKLIPS